MKHDLPNGYVSNSVTQAGSILRDVIIQSQPHMLGRPGRTVVDNLPPAQLTKSPQILKDTVKSEKPVDVERLLSEARQAGYAAGYAAATEESEAKDVDECRRIQAAARDAGYQEGKAKGEEDAKSDSRVVLEKSEAALKKEWHKKFELLERMLKDGSAQMSARIDEAEEEIITLAFEAVGAVLGEAFATPQGIRAMVTHLLAQRRNTMQVVVHVNPGDWTMLTQGHDAEPTIPVIQWVSDSKVALGGVILHHAQGRIEAALDAVTRNLQATLLRVHEGRRHAITVAAAHAAAGQKAAA